MLKNYFSNIPIQTASTPQQIQKHNLRTISNPTPSSSTPLQHPSNSFLIQTKAHSQAKENLKAIEQR